MFLNAAFAIAEKNTRDYLHKEQSSSDKFIKTALGNHTVMKELEQNCVLWLWDCAEEDAKLKLR